MFRNLFRGYGLKFSKIFQNVAQKHNNRSFFLICFGWSSRRVISHPILNGGDPSQRRLGVTPYPVVLSEAKDLLRLCFLGEVEPPQLN